MTGISTTNIESALNEANSALSKAEWSDEVQRSYLKFIEDEKTYMTELNWYVSSIEKAYNNALSIDVEKLEREYNDCYNTLQCLEVG